MAFELFDEEENNRVALYPDWNVNKGDRLIQSRAQVLTGEENEFVWSKISSFIYIFTLNNVPIADAVILNDWWAFQTTLRMISELEGEFTLNHPVLGRLDGAARLGVIKRYRIVGPQEPFTSFTKPYQNEVMGTLSLRVL